MTREMQNAKFKMQTALIALIILASSSAALQAHHGDAGRYDEDVISVTGTVVAVQMVNPHSHIIFDVVEKGKTVRWNAELGQPQQLIKQFGWTPQTIKVGMKLTMIGRQLKGHAPFINLTERANIVMTDTGKESTAPRTSARARRRKAIRDPS
ncbi:MAG TPA: DUF6152 family protein [Vicinamibacterales bacterium]|nr:DUF6152 family protein [Vicinamibacterales bacterium]